MAHAAALKATVPAGAWIHGRPGRGGRCAELRAAGVGSPRAHRVGLRAARVGSPRARRVLLRARWLCPPPPAAPGRLPTGYRMHWGRRGQRGDGAVGYRRHAKPTDLDECADDKDVVAGRNPTRSSTRTLARRDALARARSQSAFSPLSRGRRGVVTAEDHPGHGAELVCASRSRRTVPAQDRAVPRPNARTSRTIGTRTSSPRPPPPGRSSSVTLRSI
jgi:hypothetical protein